MGILRHLASGKKTPDEQVRVYEEIQKTIDQERARVKRRIVYAVVLLLCVYISSVVVFHYLENWGWVDSIYFTTATITTVGYGDLIPKTVYGKLYTVPLMLIGIAIGFYVIYAVQDYGKSKLDTFAKHLDAVSDRLNGIRGKRGDETKGRK